MVAARAGVSARVCGNNSMINRLLQALQPAEQTVSRRLKAGEHTAGPLPRRSTAAGGRRSPVRDHRIVAARAGVSARVCGNNPMINRLLQALQPAEQTVSRPLKAGEHTARPLRRRSTAAGGRRSPVRDHRIVAARAGVSARVCGNNPMINGVHPMITDGGSRTADHGRRITDDGPRTTEGYRPHMREGPGRRATGALG